jgi:uncharacterized protein with PIN domain
VNALFQVIQNILRRTQQQNVCPQCGRPADEGRPEEVAQETEQTGARRCPQCGRPLPDQGAP